MPLYCGTDFHRSTVDAPPTRIRHGTVPGSQEKVKPGATAMAEPLTTVVGPPAQQFPQGVEFVAGSNGGGCGNPLQEIPAVF